MIKSLFLFVTCLWLWANPSFSQPIVQTTAGKISGSKTKDGKIWIFKGIPFAQPPVGPLRWKAPQPIQAWQGIKSCTSFSASPMQAEPKPFSMWSAEFLIPKDPINEDCLYLNIWAEPSVADKKPVLVWIYGGGFASGGSAVPIYDGTSLAKKGIVFVSINYRVGPFGFFAHPELSAESGHQASGNYGLLDQLAALQWIEQNIAAFGGDPNQVTIAGQSAGAMSVSYLVGSPLSKGLFKQAIAESGAGFGRPPQSLQEAEREGQKAAAALGISSLEELRKLPADEVMQKIQVTRGPIIDGYVVPEPLEQLFAAGKQQPIHLLTGWNEEEGILPGPIKDAKAFRQNILETYGAQKGKALLAFYPASTDREAAQSQVYLARDLFFGISNYTWANFQSKWGNTYVYRFKRKVPARGEYLQYGAFHTGEVPYVLHNLNFVDRPWETADFALANTLSDYWVNFTKTGNPNEPGLPTWPRYQPTAKQILWINLVPKAIQLPDEAALDFLSHLLSPTCCRHIE